MEKMPVDNLIKMVGIMGKFGSVMADVFEDGKIDWSDASSALGLFSALKDLPGIEFGMLVPEIKDMDEEEIKLLHDKFVEVFDMSDDGVEIVVENGMKVLVDISTALMKLIGMVKK